MGKKGGEHTGNRRPTYGEGRSEKAWLKNENQGWGKREEERRAYWITGEEERFFRIDYSEYAETASNEFLTASPPGII
ncbi:hypothetical protein L6452_35901 [Arctium lappa]|uniref:Uncharacterized protein n=1 Tax=Arctium lappa TaxID=4217 RepID=A0ACB8Y8X2_ARCLA|nr:hypothetical protein L6452_35901 [Arctium lappa]